MAKPKPDIRVICGKIPITFPGDCSYVCYCTPESGCHWAVTCGDWTTGGKGVIAEPQLQPHATVAGKLAVCAKILEQRWKRPVIVPAKLRHRTIRKRTFRGTPEQIVQALGLEFGPKRKR
jgi:hypothetical protein